MSTNDEVKVIAFLPCIEKQDLRLQYTEYSLTISVDTPQRRFHKEVRLPAEVDPERAETSFRNSVLEVTLLKKKT